MPVITQTLREKREMLILQILNKIKKEAQTRVDISNELTVTEEEHFVEGYDGGGTTSVHWNIYELVPYKKTFRGITLKSGHTRVRLFLLREFCSYSASYVPRLAIIKAVMTEELNKLSLADGGDILLKQKETL